jgi:hypothetical protein
VTEGTLMLQIGDGAFERKVRATGLRCLVVS